MWCHIYISKWLPAKESPHPETLITVRIGCGQSITVGVVVCITGTVIQVSASGEPRILILLIKDVVNERVDLDL